MASVLGGTLAELGVPRERLGPGGRDMTRMAGCNSDLLLDTLLQNRGAVLSSLRCFADRMERACSALESGEPAPLLALLSEARQWQLK
ncbi:MAG: prephenate dehydrogenase dimerization domain-containing protein [Longimicrobiales bacterium]